MDACIFQYKSKKDKILLTLHVDDLLVAASKSKLLDQLAEYLRSTYEQINYHHGDDLSYIGMQFKFDRIKKSVKVDQQGYLDKLFDTHQISESVANPAKHDLFESKSDSPKMDTKKYKSMVMQIMYIALQTRPDILLLPISYLSTIESD